MNGLEKYEGKSDLSVDWQVTNLSSDEGWDEAMEGCDYVLHVASPIAMQLPKDEDEMVKPAVEGTLRVLKAASKAGVKRVVITSSVAAIMYGTINKVFLMKKIGPIQIAKQPTYMQNQKHWLNKLLGIL